MSPWNIISKFRSKAPVQATKLVREPEAPSREDASLTVASDEVLTTHIAPVASAMDPDHERVVVRVTAHQPSSGNSTLDEQRSAIGVAVNADGFDDSVHVSEAAPPMSNVRPTYDLRTRKKAVRGPRVDLKFTRAKPVSGQADTPPSDERGEYVIASVGLDDDIKQLRAALAEKLETQNEQLREMLSRFEAR